jgi:subtilase family serine protease
MRIKLCAQRLTGCLALGVVATVAAGCGGAGVTPAPGVNSAMPQGVAQTNFVRQQIAAGNFIEACPEVPFGKMRCMAMRLRDVAQAPLVRTIDGIVVRGYGPPQLQKAYELTKDVTNPGGTVVIIDAFGYPTLEGDLGVYRKEFGLPRCDKVSGCLHILNQDGKPKPLPSPPTGSDLAWLGEQAIDVDMVSANCPNCHIVMIEANSNYTNSLFHAENTAARLHPSAISNSWGAAEYAGEQSDATRFFDHPGIAITASAGDDGYGVIFPSAANTVTAVGGTSLMGGEKTKRTYMETVWNGTGSGCSAYVPVPTWQEPIETKLGGCSNRIVGDVAYDANPIFGVAVYESYANDEEPPGWQLWGGTSVGAPAIAAIYALSGNTAGVPASIAYSETKHLHNVTVGSNGTCSPAYLCHGEVGYNAPTGNGTPDGIKAF